MRAYVLNFGMDRCMQAAGYPDWDWSLSRQYAGPVDPLASGVWFGEPNRPFRSQQLVAQQRRLRADDTMNADDVSPQRQAAVLSCVNSTPRASDSEAESATMPPVVAQLVSEWSNTISAAAAAAADTSAYYECMDAAKIPVLVGTGLPATELSEAISTLGPNSADIPASPSDPAAAGDAWQSFLRSEKTITDADWSCRQDVYQRRIGDLVPVITRFATEHSTEMADAQAQWERVAKEAADVGFTGQVGALGQ